MQIQLQGFVDPNSGETDAALADARAMAVKKALVRFGANEEQIKIVAGAVLPWKIVRSTGQDWEWILEERRYVKITAGPEYSPVLLRPMRYKDIKVDKNDVRFSSDISSVLPLYQGTLFLKADSAQDEHILLFTKGPYNVANITWQPDTAKPEQWLNRALTYYLSITDSLGRQFRTRESELFLTERSTVKRQILSVPLQFGKTDPMADFYWEEIFNYAKKIMSDPDMHLRFEGHACAIGPAKVNERLSKIRAQRFDAEFKRFLAAKQDEFSKDIAGRIEAPVGLGESKPLTVDLSDGPVVLGENESSIGRKLNRRIELVFYKNGEK
jgi:outer membrane protein OmpA-like peptidoglycan-associated protein